MNDAEPNDPAAWLLKLPHHWERKRLKLLFRLMGGGTPSKDHPEYWIGDMPWVSSKDMKADLIIDTEDHISEDAVRDSATNVVPAGTILIVARSGILRHTIPVAITGRRVAINQDIKAVLPRRHGLEARYYFFLIKGFQNQLLALWRSQGATVESLDTEIIGNTDVPVPPLLEQRAIADFLDRETAKIDALIAKQQELVERIEEHKRAYIFAGVTKGIQPAAKFKSSGVAWLGDVPEHWEIRPLKRFVSFHAGAGFPDVEQGLTDQELPFFKVKDLGLRGAEAVLTATDNSISRDTAKRLRAYIFPPKSIVMAKIGAALLMNRFRVVGVSCCLDNNMLGIECDQEHIEPDFALMLMSVVLDMRMLVNPGAVPSLNETRLGRLLVAAPSLAEQRAIVAHLRTTTGELDRIKQVAVQVVASLQERRFALITAAVSGQIEVLTEPVMAANDNRQAVRAVVGAEIVSRQGSAKNFGRVKLQKLIYLAEVHAGIYELAGNYVRQAAGPLAPHLLSETERGMDAGGFYRTVPPTSEGDGYIYSRIGKVGAHSDQLAALLGARAATLTRLIDRFKDYDTRQVEAITTLYAVWNDALIDGETPTDDRIIRGVLEEWHPEKKNKFTATDLKPWLAWMRRNDVVPTGTGSRTQLDRLFV